jgi:hypothetical protein
VKSAVKVGALVAGLTACRFGGPSGNPSAYVSFPDDATALLEASADDAEPGAIDGSVSDEPVVGEETPIDAPSTETSADSEAAIEGGGAAASDAGGAAANEGGGAAANEGGSDGASDAG